MLLLHTTLLLSFLLPQDLAANGLPFELQEGYSTTVVRWGYQRGQPSHEALVPKIVIDWTAGELVNAQPNYSSPTFDISENAINGHKYEVGQQQFGTFFVPTATCVVDKSYLLVGGLSRQGKTIIEKWELSWPMEIPAPVIDLETGLSSVPVVLPSLGTKTRIYAEDVPGRTWVRNLCGLRRQGQAAEALVQFYDSNDIYTIDLATGHLTFLATAGSGATFTIPALTNHKYVAINYGDRSGIGYSYSFVRGYADQTTVPTVILIDVDRNGSIDNFLELNDAEWNSQGWSQQSNYANYWQD
jgi:hypothetical protein